MRVLAHITEENGQVIEQSLKDHCLHTACYAKECLESIGLGETAYLAGLLHDQGKGVKEGYQKYLWSAFRGEKVHRGSVNHTFCGVIYILERFHKGGFDENPTKLMEYLTSEIIACGIGGHHGIFDCTDLDKGNGFLHRLEKDREEIGYEEAVDHFHAEIADEQTICDLFQKAEQEISDVFQKMQKNCIYREEKFFQLSMLTRLIQSAVMYGDRRDTREFMSQRPSGQWHVDWQQEIDYYEEKISQFTEDTLLNQVRSDISRQCKAFAVNPTAIYRLNVPTGGGKTLSVLRYALWHAKEHGKRRIIFIIPLLSILDQNAKVLREYIANEDMILEHHSNVVQEVEAGEETDRYAELTQGWDSPIVISTLVQLLDILFSHKTQAIARMQALCDSVIVIDEIQSLPMKTTAMFSMAMNFLSQYCNTTVVLSSATQPTFEHLKTWQMRLAEKPDMVQLTVKQKEVFHRAEILDRTSPYGMDWEECTMFCRDRVEESGSLLMICNTKKEAKTLYERLQNTAQEEWQIHHLSTAMCQEHRMETLSAIQERLKEVQEKKRQGQPYKKVICIATQLVEAGVDFSFECVIRILAGIDNLSQATGRCNRSNEYGSSGKVYLINLKEENLQMLPEIARAQESTQSVLINAKKDTEENLISDRSAAMFYRALYQKADREIKYPVSLHPKDKKKDVVYLTDFLANQNAFGPKQNYSVLRQPFKTVGTWFQVFDQDTVDVIVPYGEGKKIIEALERISDQYNSYEELDALMKEAKRYTISMFQYQKKALDECGLIFPIWDGRIFTLHEKAYHWAYGLIDLKEQPVDHFIL